MNELQVFKSDQFGQVRTSSQNGEPLFVAADVCRALEISKHRDAVSRLDDDERGSVEVDTLGGKQDMTADAELVPRELNRQTGLSLRHLASTIITQAADQIEIKEKP